MNWIALFLICGLLCICATASYGVENDATRDRNEIIKPDKPPFALTLERTKNWTPASNFASAENVSTVPLARRIHAPILASQLDINHQAKVLYAPDGMNNFANYLTTQNKFNLYNFTHWPQIDLLNWFAGTADHAVHIPSKPWVEAAHKNGVKVIGSVFLAIAQWGGNPNTVETFLEQDSEGRFIYAHKLIEIADYYGFDGWLMNQETDLAAVKDADNNLLKAHQNLERSTALGEKMLEFMKYFTAISPHHMEIHWYDSMIKNGRVKWQNELNNANKIFLHDIVPSADAIFLNYWWNEKMVLNSVKQAESIERSAFDVYFGVDLWPARNAQAAFRKTKWLRWLFDPDTKKARVSLALFAPNFNYNFPGNEKVAAFSQFEHDPNDHQRFYANEQRLFSGDNMNSARIDTKGWLGLDSYLPLKSTFTKLPINTSFNTGQGKSWFERGKAISGAWTNISKQDILPSWQFAILDDDKASTLMPYYDFDKAFEGGSSLGIRGKTSDPVVRIPLFQTAIESQSLSQFTLIASGTTEQVSIYVDLNNGETYLIDINQHNLEAQLDNWQTFEGGIDITHEGKIVQIGLEIKTLPQQVLAINIGKMAFY